MEDVCADSGGPMQRDLYPSLRARSGSFGTDSELWSGFVVERSDHDLRGLGSGPSGDNLISWSGDCRVGKANGTGVLSWINDGKLAGRYSGPMVDVKAQGLGTIEFRLDNQHLHYEGSLLNSELDG